MHVTGYRGLARLFSDLSEVAAHTRQRKQQLMQDMLPTPALKEGISKLTWLVLGGDPAARSHRVEQLTAL